MWEIEIQGYIEIRENSQRLMGRRRECGNREAEKEKDIDGGREI